VERVVVGADGSSGSAVALEWAGTFAARSGCEVVAVHGFLPPWSEMSHDDHDRLVAERRATLKDSWIKPATEAGAPVRSVVKNGDPRDVLIGTRSSEDAALLVVGRVGQAGGPGFLHLGSVAEHLAHHVDGPLAVIPAGGAGPIQHIVVGVDGSAASRTAVQWCVPVAKAFDADVVAVTVIELHPKWESAPNPSSLRQEAEGRLEDWVTPLTDEGVAVELVVQGDLHPADGLLGTASARGGDLMVVGARGLGGFSGLRAGGVAMKVLHRATISLVLVPSAE
jgi:nucleotide-binding universal stress UspA family protein